MTVLPLGDPKLWQPQDNPTQNFQNFSTFQYDKFETFQYDKFETFSIFLYDKLKNNENLHRKISPIPV